MAEKKVVIQNSIFNKSGTFALAPGAAVEIRNADTAALVSLWEDRDAAVGESNPFTADANGQFTVYANQGRVDIIVTVGAEVNTWADVWLLDVDADGNVAGAFPRNWIAGLTLSNDAGDTAKDINVTAGEALDSTGAYNITLSAETTKKIDATWAAGDDAGGMNDNDAPLAAAADTVHVFLLGKSTDRDAGEIGFDVSVTPTNLLADAVVTAAGWDIYRRIGSILVDATPDIRQFFQYGDFFQLAARTQEFTETPASTNRITKTLVYVPDGVEMRGLFNIFMDIASGDKFLILAPVATDDLAASASHNTIKCATGSTENGEDTTCMTNASAQIIYRVTSISTVNVILFTVGWYDRRGKDD